VRPGDVVTVEVLEGRRRSGVVTVAGLVHDLTGYGAYLELDALNRWLGDGDTVSGVFLDTDEGATDTLYAAFKEMPVVAGVMNRDVALRSFRDTMGETLLIFGLVNLALASTIAVGMVYNGLRTALSERERELASLRVLGYTAGEVAFLLIGEIVVLTIVAIPLGFVLGHAFCAYLARRLASDLYRIPVVLDPPTYAWAAVVVLVTTVACAALMARHVRRLDLVGALKVAQ
jgi:putative ABC transport system permease protein